MEKLILQPYSVLMSVYGKEDPAFFEESLESLCIQTYPADEITLVCDGQLGEALESVLKIYSDKLGDTLNIVRLSENRGTAHAANIGLDACKNEYILKMDSDDICLAERAEIQMSFLAENPDVDIVGSYIEEFSSETGDRLAVRKTPLNNEEIRKFAKRRSPFNNQTLVYKKSQALAIGGYSAELVRCEDYDFMVRMLMQGIKAANIPQSLVRYRVNRDNLNRRRNWNNTKSFIKVRKKIHKMGFSGFWDFLFPCMSQLLLFITPTFVTKFVYDHMLRSK